MYARENLSAFVQKAKGTKRMKNKELYQALIYLRRHAQEALENFTMMELGVEGKREELEGSILKAQKYATEADERLLYGEGYDTVPTVEQCNNTDDDCDPTGEEQIPIISNTDVISSND